MTTEFLRNYPYLLSISDVSQILGISTQTARKWIKDGKIYSTRMGRNIKVPMDKLQEFIIASNNAPSNKEDSLDVVINVQRYVK